MLVTTSTQASSAASEVHGSYYLHPGFVGGIGCVSYYHYLGVVNVKIISYDSSFIVEIIGYD